MPEFPHLRDDSFPHLGTVNPYRRKVDFDYGRYDYTATLKLCNVSWPMDYRHTVNWKGASARDEYLEGLDGQTIELQSGFAHVQLDTVMVPVPYDVCLMYNYVYMRVPELTQDAPIDYEDGPHIRTICAFIAGCTYHSPSTTELTLALDTWTTYLPHLAQTTLMLHRGHAPAYATSASDYLANPRDNCHNLMTPDVSFGVPDVTAHSDLLPIGAGEKMLVIASTIPSTAIGDLATAKNTSGDSSAPTYYNTGARNGHQVGVSGYEWHYGGHSYQNMRNPSHYTGVGSAVPTFASLYAIPSARAQSALEAFAEKMPQFIQSVQAAYILPRNVLAFASGAIKVAGIELFVVTPSPELIRIGDIKLTKALFGYPRRYADIAKLYTSPYARMVVSDTLGREIEVRIEDMGKDARIMQQLSPVAECLRWDVLLTGVASAGTNKYAWKNLAAQDVPLTLPGADVARYTLELGIPTYALYLDARAAHAADGWYDAQAKRESAINAYQATMRGANTGKENADDSADTGKANADASANTNVTNTANTGAAAVSNTAIANNQRTLTTARNGNLNADLVTNATNHVRADQGSNVSYTQNSNDANLKSEALSTGVGVIANIATGNLGGALQSIAGGAISITTSQTLSGYSVANVNALADHAASENLQNGGANNQAASDNTSYANAAATNTTANSVATANANAGNSAATAKANATRSQGTAKANASYSRGTTEENAKAALELERHNYERTGHAYDMANPNAYGMASGDASPDALMRRVVQVRIDTQSRGAIARAGDAMLRYGYTFDGLWAVTDWCPSGHDGCYWEAADVMAAAAQFDNPAAERAFEDILVAGTTVWNDPAKIGGIPW